MPKAGTKKAPKGDNRKAPLYSKKTVYIRDNILSKYAGIDVIGVEDRGDELHLEFYIKYPDGKILHRDIELMPDGNFDSGTIVDQGQLKQTLKNIEKDVRQ